MAPLTPWSRSSGLGRALALCASWAARAISLRSIQICSTLPPWRSYATWLTGCSRGCLLNRASAVAAALDSDSKPSLCHVHVSTRRSVLAKSRGTDSVVVTIGTVTARKQQKEAQVLRRDFSMEMENPDSRVRRRCVDDRGSSERSVRWSIRCWLLSFKREGKEGYILVRRVGRSPPRQIPNAKRRIVSPMGTRPSVWRPLTPRLS
mmetsp:Transcript_20938/g.53530  ORF Transcript_20938/g.53530 Transcript_20938/m.53530 type:complete len:206 (-) Transcript_20938:205-822(-)